MLLTCDLSRLPLSTRQRIDETLKNERRAVHARAVARQKAAIKYYRDNRPRAVNGLGEQTLAIDEVFWRHYMKQNLLAPGEDVELRNWLKKRRAEWCVVKSLPTKTQVGYGSTLTQETPLRPQTPGKLKFSKSYGEGARPMTWNGTPSNPTGTAPESKS